MHRTKARERETGTQTKDTDTQAQRIIIIIVVVVIAVVIIVVLVIITSNPSSPPTSLVVATVAAHGHFCPNLMSPGGAASMDGPASAADSDNEVGASNAWVRGMESAAGEATDGLASATNADADMAAIIAAVRVLQLEKYEFRGRGCILLNDN